MSFTEMNSNHESSLVTSTLDQYVKYRSISSLSKATIEPTMNQSSNTINCDQPNFEQSIPRVCLIAVKNTQPISADVRNDLNFIAMGFEDSIIYVWHHGPRLRKSNQPSVWRDVSHISLAIDGQEIAPSDSNRIEPSNIADGLDDKEIVPPSISDTNRIDIDHLIRGPMTIETLHAHSGPIYGLKFFPKSDFLLSCSEDTTIRLWCLKTMCNVTVYRGHVYPVWSLDVSPPHLPYFVSSSKDTTARLWTTEKNYPIRIFSSHDGDVECVKFHPNGKYIATASTDTTVRLWNVKDGKMVRLMVGHQAPVTSLTFSPDGKLIATASLDGYVRIWEIANNTSIFEHKSFEYPVYSLSFNPDQTILSICGHESTLRHMSVAPTPDHELLSEGKLNKQHKIVEIKTDCKSLIHGHYSNNNVLIVVGSQSET
ncbi:TAF5-like RNA polymerase II/CBP-associated factor-associated protein [Fragariocoptes setiger]|uniref:TAF5-like RNA polymerase II/CBP-associated factor-associated protein n=1 Tax=Fragariocoptes setiger TaxID=1670756 RepID=A0ABQ7SAD1_9ACAR|nr:TAF5-like RNA polymerase II/CBP-associated factor-associated protein [Fragariocoptes setiger]